MNLTFFVPGLPIAQGSKRAFLVKGKPVLTEMAKGLKPWRAQVAYFAQSAMREAKVTGWFAREPLTIAMIFRFPRPQALPRRITQHVRRPDVDKLTRSVFDALEKIVYGDDSQIVSMRVTKVYDMHAGVQVQMWSVEP